MLAGRVARCRGWRQRRSATAATRTPNRSDNYDELFQRYLQEAREAKAARSRTIQAWAWMSGLALDRARASVNDLITIRVDREHHRQRHRRFGADEGERRHCRRGASSSASRSKLPSAVDPTALVAAKTEHRLQRRGTTNRAGELTAQMTARVSDVLPNGDLVVEGVREIEINGDRQIVVLTGVVRAVDIGPSNVVLSTSIGQLRIRYFGRGLMKDNLKPGWLVRVLNKVF